MEITKESYIQSLFVQEDEILSSIYQGLESRGLPLISVPKEIGKLLYLLVKISQAKKILEIGTLGGYSTIWLARALPENGQLVSIDYRKEHIDFANENITRAQIQQKVTFELGEATEIMDQLIQNNETYDFIFVDADKVNYPKYIEQAIALSVSGTNIVMDNLFFHGRVLNMSDQNEAPRKLREANQMLANDPRLESMLIPIGDGLGVARVK